MYYVLRVLCLHIWNQVYKTLTTFQVFKSSLSDWFGSKCKCKTSSYLILLHCKPNLRFNLSYLSFIVNFVHLDFFLFFFTLYLFSVFYPIMSKPKIDIYFFQNGLKYRFSSAGFYYGIKFIEGSYNM